MTDRAIHPAALAEANKANAGKPYRPSNGHEGEVFMSHWCEKCHHDRHADKDAGRGCRLIVLMMAYDEDHKDYPKQIQYGADGQPLCTKFVERGSVKAKRRKGPPSAKNAVGDMFK